MRINNGVAKYSGVLVFVLATLLFTTDQAVAQSTDACENVGGSWYKYTFVTGGPAQYVWPSRDSMLAPWYPHPTSQWNCPDPSDTNSKVACRPTCVPHINLHMLGTTDIRARYTGAGTIAGVGCATLGTVYNATAAGVFSRQLQTNPTVQCPANPPPPFQSEDCCNPNGPRLGNPSSPSSGTKYLDEVDYAGAPGLDLRRSYATARSYTGENAPINPAFGSASWLHNYERSLHVVNTAQNGGVRWIAQRQDGSLLYFRANGTEVLNRSDTGASSTITTLANNTG